MSTQSFLEWNCHTDQLLFKFDELIDYATSLPPTKRSVLKIRAKIFDPLGPFVIRLKIMFRRLCMEKVDWDEVLEKELVKQWKVILAELRTLSGVKIDKCYFIAIIMLLPQKFNCMDFVMHQSRLMLLFYMCGLCTLITVFPCLC